MENSTININKKIQENTSEFAVTDYEELNDMELEDVAGGKRRSWGKWSWGKPDSGFGIQFTRRF